MKDDGGADGAEENLPFSIWIAVAIGREE